MFSFVFVFVKFVKRHGCKLFVEGASRVEPDQVKRTTSTLTFPPYFKDNLDPRVPNWSLTSDLGLLSEFLEPANPTQKERAKARFSASTWRPLVGHVADIDSLANSAYRFKAA